MRTAAVLLFAMLAVTYAACPNQCSGHGRCGANDQCECYKQAGTPWGQRAGWTGADCSLRTCALDTAFDSISNIPDQVGGKQHLVTYSPADASALTYAQLRTRIADIPLTVTLQGNLLSPYHAVAADITSGNSLRTISSDNTIVIRMVSYDPVTTHSGTFQWKWKHDERAGGSDFSQPIAFTARAATAPSTVINEATDIMLRDPPQAINAAGVNGVSGTGVQNTYPTGVRVWFRTGAGVGGSTEATLYQPNDIYQFQVTRSGGTHYLDSNDNSFHQQVECSGRGLCDRASGQCKCDVGYDGEACQRTTCKNSCSGHGVCQDESHFFTDAGVTTYAQSTTSVEDSYLGPFDAYKQMGCKCDKGYRGPDCSLIECPSGTDPLLADTGLNALIYSDSYPGSDGKGAGVTWNTNEQVDGPARDCSGRGTCDYSAGVCKCYKGYFGERCETQTNFV